MELLALGLVILVGFLIFTKVVKLAFKLIGIVIIIGLIYFLLTSGTLASLIGGLPGEIPLEEIGINEINVDEIQAGSADLSEYNSETGEFSLDIAGFTISGKVGETALQLKKGGIVLKTIELPEPAKVKDGALLVSDKALEFIKDQIVNGSSGQEI